MPRPLREPDIRNPTKIQNAFATPVGADPCAGPLQHVASVHGRTHRCAPTRSAWLCLLITQASREAFRRPAVFLRNLKLRHAPLRGFAAQSGVQGHCPCKYKTNAGFDGFPTFCGMDFCAIISAMARVKPRRT